MLVGVVAAVACALSASAVAGPEWVEHGDAGPVIGSAQPTQGTGNLGSIRGRLGVAGTSLGPIDLEDMFLIKVIDPTTFTMQITSATFNPQLFVFNVTLPGEAFGLLANDDTNSGMLPFIDRFSTDGTGAQINLPGVYAIAVSGAGRNPTAFNGNLLFNYISPTEVSGPDGPGGFLPHTGWTGDGETGDYLIDFTGTEFYDVPGPASAALLLIAIGIVPTRRRRLRQ